jgi:hypothetical protein
MICGKRGGKRKQNKRPNVQKRESYRKKDRKVTNSMHSSPRNLRTWRLVLLQKKHFFMKETPNPIITKKRHTTTQPATTAPHNHRLALVTHTLALMHCTTSSAATTRPGQRRFSTRSLHDKALSRSPAPGSTSIRPPHYNDRVVPTVGGRPKTSRDVDIVCLGLCGSVGWSHYNPLVRDPRSCSALSNA